jgi:hypothetical protein
LKPLLPSLDNPNYLKEQAIFWLNQLPREPHITYSHFRFRLLGNLKSKDWGEFTTLLLESLQGLLEGLKDVYGTNNSQYIELFMYLEQQK